MSIAGLPDKRASVGVEPPFLAKDPSRGFVLGRLVIFVRPALSVLRLCPASMIPDAGEFAKIELRTATIGTQDETAVDVLSAKVQLATVTGRSSMF
jgi:hypothetical protein